VFDLPILQASQAELPFLKGFEAGPLEHPKSLDDDIDMMAFTVIIILYIYYYITLYCIILGCFALYHIVITFVITFVLSIVIIVCY